MRPIFVLRFTCLLLYYSHSSGNHKYILKYIPKANFTDLHDINNRLHGIANHVRLVEDTVPDKSVFVFQYFADHLLHFVRKDLPLAVTKRILKDALCGIAELHDQDIVHTGNALCFEKQFIMTDFRQTSRRIIF